MESLSAEKSQLLSITSKHELGVGNVSNSGQKHVEEIYGKHRLWVSDSKLNREWPEVQEDNSGGKREPVVNEGTKGTGRGTACCEAGGQ